MPLEFEGASAHATQPSMRDIDSSPNASLAQWKSPVLLIHGDDDRNVKVSQSVDLAARLRENNVAFRELIIPDEIHDFLLWKTWIPPWQLITLEAVVLG